MLPETGMKYFIYAIIGIVVISVVGGFFIVGSPFEERIRRFDKKRVSDLQFVQSEIITYWINKQKLPERLSLLKDDIRGVVIPRDPETGVEYEYAILEEKKFALCAVFSRQNSALEPTAARPISVPYYEGENWEHDTGRVCFERTIDPDIYRPRSKEIPAQD